MASVLSECTVIEQRAVVRFLWAKGRPSKDIHKEMLSVYGERCLSHKAVRNWVEKFNKGRSHLEDDERAGRPVEIATDAAVNQVDDLIKSNRRLSLVELAAKIGCSKGLAFTIVHDRLQYCYCMTMLDRMQRGHHKRQSAS